MVGRKVSILIASRNAKGDLPKLFESLKKITYPRRLYEIVFVDDGSTDGSWKMAREFGARVFRFDKRQGRAKARNKALQLARHPIVAWIDSDCEIADRRWIENMMKHLKGKTIGVAGNQLKPKCGLPRVLYYLPGTAYTADKTEEASFAPTTSSLFLKKPIIDAGGFDSSLVTAEDLELCWRLGSKGYKFVKTPEAAIYHNFRATMSGFAKQQYERGVFGGHLFRKKDMGPIWRIVNNLIFFLPFAGIAAILFPQILWALPITPLVFHVGLGYVNFFPAVLWLYVRSEKSFVGALQLIAAEYVKTYATLLGLLAYQLKNIRN